MKLDYKTVSKKLSRRQENTRDMRDKVRECNSFCFDEWGQWQPIVKQAWAGRPKFQFDKTNDLVDTIAGEFDGLKVGAKVRPAGGGANREKAELRAGVLRYIENLSSANAIYKKVNRSTVRVGFSVLQAKNEYAFDDSFDQDIVIKYIPNAVDRVWFGEHYEQDGSDIKEAWLLHVGDPEDMREKFGLDRQIASIGNDNDQTYTRDNLNIKLATVAEYFYLKPYKKELVLMSDGSVYEDDENFAKVADELAQQGRVEVRRRTVTCHKQCSIFYDGNGFISKEYPTPFDSITLYPVYGDFEVIDDRLYFGGVVKRVMDYQRVINYAGSRELEECALAPARKIVATDKQIQDNEDSFSDINNPQNPLLQYTTDPASPAPPTEIGGAQVNPALNNISMKAVDGILSTAGVTNAMQGANPKYQSGEAVKLQLGQGAAKSSKYIEPLEVATTRMYKNIIAAIPSVYDTTRTILILNEDGTDDEVTLNEEVFDRQSMQMVKLNNLNEGKYNVVVEIDKAYKTKRKETAEFAVQMSQADPTLMQTAGDIIYNSVDVADMDKVGDRKRQAMLMQGMIPENQMTDEEKDQVEQMQAQQGQQEDPNMILAMAENKKGEAAIMEQQNKQIELSIKKQQADAKTMDSQVNAARLEKETMNDITQADIDIQKTAAETANKNANTMKTLSEIEGQNIDNLNKLAENLTPDTGI